MTQLQQQAAPHHVSQRDVEEHAPRQCEDPVRREVAPCQDAEAHAQVAAAGRQKVKEESLLDAHAGVEQYHKVTFAHRAGGRGQV